MDSGAAQFDTFVHKAPIGAYIVDEDLRIRDIHPVALPAFGGIPQLIGQDLAVVLRQLCSDPETDQILRRFTHALNTGERFHRIEKGNGRVDRDSKPWCGGRIERITLEDGCLGVICYVGDISRAVNAREEIGLSEERFRTFVTGSSAQPEQERRFYEAILSSTPDLVYVFDLNHRFTYANQALLTMWGKTAEEAIGKNCLELGYEPWHAAMHDREIEQVIATGKPIRGDVPFSGTQGRRIYDYIFVPVFGPNGEVEAVAGTTRDVTDRYLAEQALRSANQDLEQFAYAATHDLQEPLRSVKVYSELLERRYADRLDGQALEFLTFLRTGATRMEMLIRDLLSYTQAGRLETVDEMADAGICLQAALENLAASVEESGARIFAESLPSVRIQATELQQLFQNLIGNAIKYHRPGVPPVVEISARSEDGNWHFTVADNGIGIEDQYKDRIFGLFKRLHTNDKYAGTGIGLALCQRIVERNHGRIWVESEPGQGAQFHFTLPA